MRDQPAPMNDAMSDETGNRAAPLPTSEPLVSVVTPFYNTEDYLEQCIRSVLAQTHQNFEYILADNCSSDRSLAIARSYAATDPRIRVITHEAFIDQDPNYNRALRYISPESRYTKIVQADDWIYPECLTKMVDLAERHPSAGIIGCCFIAGPYVVGHGLPFDRELFTGHEACRTRLLRGGTYFGSPTNLLYRSEIVRTRAPFFGENETNADTTACFEILENWDFARVPQILAFIRTENTSISTHLERLGTGTFFNYALVARYGPEYLDADEFRARLGELEEVYLRFMARRALDFPGREYWDFHRQALASIGRRLPKGRVALYTADFLLNKLLNPRQTTGLMIDRWRERDGSPRPGP